MRGGSYIRDENGERQLVHRTRPSGAEPEEKPAKKAPKKTTKSSGKAAKKRRGRKATQPATEG